MMANRNHVSGALLALLLAVPGSALAQKGSVELGVDMSLSHNMIDQASDNVTQISVPFGGSLTPVLSPQTGLRVAFYVSDVIAIEPVTTFSYFKEGDDNLTSWTFATKLLWHFSEDVTRPRLYFGAGGAFGLLAPSGGESESQFGVTGEIGGKLPLADFFALRVAGGYARLFESGGLSTQDILFLSLGFSVSWWR